MKPQSKIWHVEFTFKKTFLFLQCELVGNVVSSIYWFDVATMNE